MITDSFSASCYVENKDGQYHMECDMQTDDYSAYSEYDGDSFVVGLNSIMDDLQEQIISKSEPEPKEMTLEERVAYLQDLVDTLREDKANLTNEINELKKAPAPTKNDAAPQKTKDIDKELSDILNNLINYRHENTEKAFDPYHYMLRFL